MKATFVKNDENLTDQSTRVGFAKNDSKTTYIPINIEKSAVLTNQKFMDAGIDEKYVLTRTGLLGFNMKISRSKICVIPAANDVVACINKNIGTVIASRSYVEEHADRVKIARTIAYHFLGKISLIYAYGFKTTRNPGFEKVQVAYNNLFRATGLRASTPQAALNSCFGTSLENFARHSVINDGFKMMKHHDIVITDVLDRTSCIRPNGIFAVDGTFMNFFARKFNEFDLENRKKLLSVILYRLNHT